MKNGALDFYTNPSHNLPIYTNTEGSIVLEPLEISSTGVFVGESLPKEIKPELSEKITKLYDSIEAVTVEEDGNEYTFEFGYLAGETNNTTLRSATYQSSLTENFGNGFEVACAAVDNPTESILYVASMGMGISSAITTAEQKYLRKHGRLLFDDNGVVKPLPVVRALGKAIFDKGYTITGIASDSAGAVMTVAYGASYGNGAITTAHQNARTGFVDKSLLGLAKGMMFDDPKLSKQHAVLSPDALKMSAEKIAFVSENIGQAYADKLLKPKKSLSMLGTYAVGLGKGPSAGDPLTVDTSAFAKANPGANILFTYGSDDTLVQGVDIDGRVVSILREVGRYSDGRVMAVTVEGLNHGMQTHYPQFLRKLAHTALQ
jgi:hypothetical protein